MTMRIVFLKDFDGYKTDEDTYVERALARRICRQGAAIPYVTLMKRKVDQEFAAEQAKAEADEQKAIEAAAKRKEAAEKKAIKVAEKKAAEKAKAAKLVEDKKGSGREKAIRE